MNQDFVNLIQSLPESSFSLLTILRLFLVAGAVSNCDRFGGWAGFIICLGEGRHDCLSRRLVQVS